MPCAVFLATVGGMELGEVELAEKLELYSHYATCLECARQVDGEKDDKRVAEWESHFYNTATRSSIDSAYVVSIN